MTKRRKSKGGNRGNSGNRRLTPEELAAVRAVKIETVAPALGLRLHKKRGPCPLCKTSSSSTAFASYGDHWTCYACNENGDAIDLAERLLGLSFVDAVRFVAQIAGIPLGDEMSDEVRQRLREQEQLRKDESVRDEERERMKNTAYREWSEERCVLRKMQTDVRAAVEVRDEATLDLLTLIIDRYALLAGRLEALLLNDRQDVDELIRRYLAEVDVFKRHGGGYA